MVMLKDPTDKVAIKRLNDEVKKGLAPEELESIEIRDYF